MDSIPSVPSSSEILHNYVAGFLICRTTHSVALVKKRKPEWQRGKLNGVGGKIEPGEAPYNAMVREFREEAGIEVLTWEPFVRLVGRDWTVTFFRAFTDNWADPYLTSHVRTVEKEEVVVIGIDRVTPKNALPNLSWLIPMALSLDLDKCDGFVIHEMYGKDTLAFNTMVPGASS